MVDLRDDTYRGFSLKGALRDYFLEGIALKLIFKEMSLLVHLLSKSLHLCLDRDLPSMK